MCLCPSPTRPVIDFGFKSPFGASAHIKPHVPLACRFINRPRKSLSLCLCNQPFKKYLYTLHKQQYQYKKNPEISLVPFRSFPIHSIGETESCHV